MERCSSTGHVAKRGRHGPRATQPPVPPGTEIVGAKKKEKKKKEKKDLCKKEIEEEFEEVEVEEEEPLQKEEKHENDKQEEVQQEQPIILCKKVAIDWHGVLADSDNRVSEDSLCAVEKLLEKGIEVTILSYGGHERNKATLNHLKE